MVMVFGELRIFKDKVQVCLYPIHGHYGRLERAKLCIVSYDELAVPLFDVSREFVSLNLKLHFLIHFVRDLNWIIIYYSSYKLTNKCIL